VEAKFDGTHILGTATNSQFRFANKRTILSYIGGDDIHLARHTFLGDIVRRDLSLF
jgi:hypothetical protein